MGSDADARPPVVRPELRARPGAGARASAWSTSRSGCGSASRATVRLRKLAILLVLAGVWQAYAAYLNNPLAVPDLHRDAAGVLRAHRQRRAAWRARGSSLKVLLQGYVIGLRAARSCSRCWPCVAHRQRPARDADLDVQPAAGDRAAAARADLARPRQPEHRVRARACGDVADRAEHALGLPRRVEHAAHGRAQLRPQRAALRRADPDPGRVPEHPDRAQDRLGLRLAHADRRRAGVRRDLGLRAVSAGSSTRTRTRSTSLRCSPACSR